MDFFLRPSKKPTPSEYSVLTFAVSLLLLALGTIALVMGYSAPPEKAELAGEAMRYGAASLGIGVAILIARRLVRAFIRS